MRKIVAESLEESINEGLMSSVKDFFKKIGKFFMATFKGEQVPVMSPINIGILSKEGHLPHGVQFYPSKELIKLEPSLSVLRVTPKVEPFKGKGKMHEAEVAQQHPDPEVPNLDEPEMMRRIRMALRNRSHSTPLLIWGTPGVAKTAIVTGVLKALGDNGTVITLPLATMRRDDWFLPRFVVDEMGFERAEDVPKTWLPVYKKTGDPVKDAKGNDYANRGNGGVLFLDELSRSDKGVTATLLTLVNERHVGEWYLGDKWAIISASNRQDDDPTQPFSASSALCNRFSQINFIAEFKYWKQWATGQKVQNLDKARLRPGQWKKIVTDFEVDPRILNFLEFNKDYAYALDNEATIWASFRTWTNTSKNINAAIEDEMDTNEPLSYDELLKIVASDVGMKAATEFMTFMKLLQKFTTEDIKEVLTDPKKAKMPGAAGKGFDISEANALLSVVCSYTKEHPITPKEWANYNKYLVKLDNGSLATKGFTRMIACNDFINKQLGEITDPKTGKLQDEYVEGYNIFIEKYGKMF